jgi:hypothetical protein
MEDLVMEDLGACYLCSRYKATYKTNGGVAICPICKDDLHEDAARGDEFLKPEEKTPNTFFKGKDVKLTVNGYESKPWSKEFPVVYIDGI